MILRLGRLGVFRNLLGHHLRRSPGVFGADFFQSRFLRHGSHGLHNRLGNVCVRLWSKLQELFFRNRSCPKLLLVSRGNDGIARDGFFVKRNRRLLLYPGSLPLRLQECIGGGDLGLGFLLFGRSAYGQSIQRNVKLCRLALSLQVRNVFIGDVVDHHSSRVLPGLLLGGTLRPGPVLNGTANAPQGDAPGPQKGQQSQGGQNDDGQHLAQGQLKQNSRESSQDAATGSGSAGAEQLTHHGKATG